MTLSTGSRSNPALGSYEGFITSLFNFISHFYPSTAQVYCASSHPSPLLFLEPYSSFCSPDKILLRLIHLNSHSALKSPMHPPPLSMPLSVPLPHVMMASFRKQVWTLPEGFLWSLEKSLLGSAAGQKCQGITLGSSSKPIMNGSWA